MDKAMLDQGFHLLERLSTYCSAIDTLVDCKAFVPRRRASVAGSGSPDAVRALEAMQVGEIVELVEPEFSVGDVVQHKYFGVCVVVGWDKCCEADEAWISGNKVRQLLDRGVDQPFYHVLCDDGTERYCSEENIRLIESDWGVGVRHPFVPHYFSGSIKQRPCNGTKWEKIAMEVEALRQETVGEARGSWSGQRSADLARKSHWFYEPNDFFAFHYPDDAGARQLAMKHMDDQSATVTPPAQEPLPFSNTRRTNVTTDRRGKGQRQYT